MDIAHEIMLSDEKFAGIGSLRDLLLRLDHYEYCSFGSFLSSIHFKRSFTSPFELLLKDEAEVLEALSNQFEVDNLHGTITLDDKHGDDKTSTLKIRFVDSSIKNHEMRNYLVEHSEVRSCVVTNKNHEIEKFDIQVPRRGPTILALLLELDNSPQEITAIIEKIVWSLRQIGVAPLLRESRFVPQHCIYEASDIIEDLFVAHANKTVTMLHSHSTGECRTITAADLKKLGRPYAALLRA